MRKLGVTACSGSLVLCLNLLGCSSGSKGSPDGSLGLDGAIPPLGTGGMLAPGDIDGGTSSSGTGGIVIAPGGGGGSTTPMGAGGSTPRGTGGSSLPSGTGGAVGRGGAGGGSTLRGTGGNSLAPASGGATGRGGRTGRGTGGRSLPAGTGGAPDGAGGSLLGTGGATAQGGAVGSGSPMVAGCRIFPPDNPWNQDISGLPLHPKSATYISNMSPSTTFHPDWGTLSDHYGIPFGSGTGNPPVPITWTASWGPTQSDQLPCPTGSNKFCYPIPLDTPIEGGPSAASGSDRHVLYIDTAGAPDNCTLYELYQTQNPNGSSGWTAANGAIFPLGTNALRPDGWTSADAAGLPILPGLVRYQEVMDGEIKHAIRFTVETTSNGYIHPATHYAGDSNTSLPPMGLRLRLKASFNTSRFSGPTLVIMTAMKKYGLILADNGSDWYITGESHEGWEPLMDGLLSGLGQLRGSDFEAVDTGPILTD